VDVSPGGENVLVIRTVRPFSYLVPSGGFPQEIDVWNLKGDVVRHIATLPSSEGVPIRGVRTGPRGVNWRPGTPATLVWAEALDGGDPRSKAEFEDRVVTVSAPFTAEPTQLARLNLITKKTERLWRADTVHYESVIALLDDAAKSFVTRRESRSEPPNYFVRQGTRLRALTAFKDPAPQLTGIQKRLLTYTREDGVPLSGTLYLPPGYTPGTRLPVVMWAYPIEFASASAAGQVSAAPNRFNIIRGPSHLFFLTQ